MTVAAGFAEAQTLEQGDVLGEHLANPQGEGVRSLSAGLHLGQRHHSRGDAGATLFWHHRNARKKERAVLALDEHGSDRFAGDKASAIDPFLRCARTEASVSPSAPGGG